MTEMQVDIVQNLINKRFKKLQHQILLKLEEDSIKRIPRTKRTQSKAFCSESTQSISPNQQNTSSKTSKIGTDLFPEILNNFND